MMNSIALMFSTFIIQLAVVTQLVECQPSKLNVASSNLVRRSILDC